MRFANLTDPNYRLLTDDAGKVLGVVDPTGRQSLFGADAVRGSALIANNTAGSISIPTTPTPVVWSGVRVPDAQFDLATGVITFATDRLFTSTFYSTLTNTGGGGSTLTYFTDAEVSLDGGTTWVRGTESLRREVVRGSDAAATRSFPFAGRFLAGTKLRFVHWASSAGCVVTTTSDSGSTCPALRLTYNSAAAVL